MSAASLFHSLNPFRTHNTGSSGLIQPNMDPGFSTASLDALQNDDQRKVLDVVDHLRRTGLSSILNLPQIVVCGDQSSGKSSVLEAITEIPFPRKENLCTRFATEIILKRDNASSVTATITPDKTKTQAEQDKLREFHKTVDNLDDFASLVEEATLMMGLDGVSDGVDELATKAFTGHVLRVEICGPDRPQLTLVDLPGIIQSRSKDATDKDVKLIQDLVKTYIVNQRTIILAVVSAKNDFNNQIILEYCRSSGADPKGSRTLGIITKPDQLIPGTTNEKKWMSLALNNEVHFNLGWHVLKNRSEKEMSSTFQARNADERTFFSNGIYKDLPEDMLGIETLRTRLSTLLHNHLKNELPSLKKELLNELSSTQLALSHLGANRSSTREQRDLLSEVSMKFYVIVDSAVKGHYEHPFFGGIDIGSAIGAGPNLTRLRAVVQELNLNFAEKMRRQGHKYAIAKAEHSYQPEVEASSDEGGSQPSTHATFESEEDTSSDDDEGWIAKAPNRPTQKTRREAEDWVLGVLRRSRGLELPGNFNPMLISHLFWEQSEPWKDLAHNHIENVAKKCGKFVELVLKTVATEDIQRRMWELKIDGALKNALTASRSELDKILEDKNRHPITYNHYYTTTIQKERQKILNRGLDQCTDEATVAVHEKTFMAGSGYSTKHYIDPEKLQEAMDKNIVLDMDRFCAQEALSSQQAFYKVCTKLGSPPLPHDPKTAHKRPSSRR